MGSYVPQLGDRVVYFMELHRQHIEETMSSRSRAALPQWDDIGDLRFAEPCEVESIDYIISSAECSPSIARLTLVLSDPEQEVFGKQLVVDLPPPTSGYEEFLIQRERFDDAVERQWEIGSTCKVGWCDEGSRVLMLC